MNAQDEWWTSDPDYTEWLDAAEHEQFPHECAEYEQGEQQ